MANNKKLLDDSSYNYDDFKVSDSTAAADQKRQELASQKPSDFTYNDYAKSDTVKQAESMLQQQLGNKPGEYQSAWQTQLDDTLNKILNREKFTYDLNGDALYQQYKDQYILQGQQAMMDTMGQAAAMTGGYGNSYAQTVGQQTYQGYLQQLNDKVPELYQLALNQYNQEGQDLYNQYGLFADRDSADYGRYRDNVSDYYTELNRLTDDARYQSEQDYGRYMDAYNMAYGQHRDQVSDYYTDLGMANEDYWNQYNRDYGQYSDNRNLSYQQYRDQVSDAQWNQTFQYQQGRDATADAQWQAQFDEAKRQYDQSVEPSKGSGGSDGNGNGGSKVNNGSRSEAEIKAMQKALGVDPDGKWGPKTQAAAKEKWGTTDADEAWKAHGGNPDETSFTGSTYSEAAAWLKAKGHSSGGLMTQAEWTRHKNGNNSAGGEHEASSYQEYLNAYIYMMMNK